MNLYYSLPDSIIYKINKMMFSQLVLPKITKRVPHGEFSFMLKGGEENNTWDTLWILILKNFYSRIHLIGLEAWDYLYRRKNNNSPSQSNEKIWSTIKQELGEYGPVPFEKGILIMENIARKGWDTFVKEYSIAYSLIH